MTVNNLVPKKILKRIDSEIEAAYKVHFNCVQIPMMDIPKIYATARELILKGSSADDVLRKMAESYKNGWGIDGNPKA